MLECGLLTSCLCALATAVDELLRTITRSRQSAAQASDNVLHRAYRMLLPCLLRTNAATGGAKPAALAYASAASIPGVVDDGSISATAAAAALRLGHAGAALRVAESTLARMETYTARPGQDVESWQRRLQRLVLESHIHQQLTDGMFEAAAAAATNMLNADDAQPQDAAGMRAEYLGMLEAGQTGNDTSIACCCGVCVCVARCTALLLLGRALWRQGDLRGGSDKFAACLGAAGGAVLPLSEHLGRVQDEAAAMLTAANAMDEYVTEMVCQRAVQRRRAVLSWWHHADPWPVCV